MSSPVRIGDKQSNVFISYSHSENTPAPFASWNWNNFASRMRRTAHKAIYLFAGSGSDVTSSHQEIQDVYLCKSQSNVAFIWIVDVKWAQTFQARCFTGAIKTLSAANPYPWFDYSQYFPLLSFRTRRTIIRECEEFCASSLSWIEECSNAEREQIDKAYLLSDDLATFVKNIYPKQEGHVDSFLAYIRARSLDRRKICNEQFRKIQDEFDGLIFYLAARFTGSLDWLGEDRIARRVLFISSIWTALGSTVSAFFKWQHQIQSVYDRNQLQRQVLIEQLNMYGIEVEYADDLGDLKGCLISTRFGFVIHVNKKLSSEQQESVCLHELGHFILRHEPISKYGLDPYLLDSNTRNQFDRQEREADGFAELWHHVLQEVIDYAMSKMPASLAQRLGIAGYATDSEALCLQEGEQPHAIPAEILEQLSP